MDNLFATGEINSIDYWNQRLFTDWIAEGGRKQTAFFAGMCCAELPPWLVEEIRARQLSILDYGCALGDALPVFRQAFATSPIRGADVAEAGLGLARALYPDFEFTRIDVAEAAPAPADIVYCSNTLEHFQNWPEILHDVARRATEYVLVVVPFEEDEPIAEHVCSFEFDSLPAVLEPGLRLRHLSVINVADHPQTYWNGRQLIAVYGKERHDKQNMPAAPLCRTGAHSLAVDLHGLDTDAVTALLAATATLSRERRRLAQRALDAATTRADESEAREQTALAEAEKQRNLAARLTRQRDAAQLAAAEAVHAEIAKIRKEQAGAERLARERGEQIDWAESELARLRAVASGSDRLAHIASRLTEKALASAATEATLRATVTELASHLSAANAKLRQSAGLASQVLAPIRQRYARAARRAGSRAANRRDWAAAERHYRRALDWNPDLMPLWVQLGHALKERGEYARAEAAYRRALALEGTAADTHLQLGHLMKLQGRFDEAAEAYAHAAHLDPRVPNAAEELENLNRRLIEEGDRARDARDWTTAVSYYRQALERKPGMMPIWVQLGHALKEQGDYVEAEAAYRRALAFDSINPDTHLQLGHLLRLQARRPQAIDAYATALRLDPHLKGAREALYALVGYSPAEAERALSGDPARLRRGESVAFGGTSGGAVAALGEPLSPAERYGRLFAEASRKAGSGRDIIWLGVIDWHYRIQRPQHLATHLADAGARVFYVSIVFEEADQRGRFRLIESPHPGVFEVRMRLTAEASDSIYQGLSASAVAELQLALDELIAMLGIGTPVVVVQHPAWHQVAGGVAGGTVVYDCLDLATGFSNVAKSLGQAETVLLADADVVVAASRPLAEHVSRQRPGVLIRNAADVEFFAQGFTERLAGERPVIGYFGAIADWFNIEWIEHCAAVRPQWEFRLIGRTDGCDISRAAQLSNVTFLGEQPYEELSSLLREVDVAVIPFKLIELTRCTNPVKLYEYMAAGKPVVAARMPEVVEATDLVYIADDAASFAECLEQALAEDSVALRRRRQEWAREHNWASRAGQFEEAIEASFPLVSVVILTYNNWHYTSECLASLRSWSDYPNLEIIVVDNASTDGTPEGLRVVQRHDNRIQVVLNDTNLGFAAGNNVGLRLARGEYVVLSNNDTVFTRGWVRDLIRPMQLDPRIALVGPLTNNIGNEQKVTPGYDTTQQMQEWARRFTRARLRRRLETDSLAFFCVAMRRSVMDEVGLLDETYGIGFFEDDDYCRRVQNAGHKLVIADDVFVHHHHSVSFDAMGGKASELMARNKALFEERWGQWQPHRYRDEPGFG